MKALLEALLFARSSGVELKDICKVLGLRKNQALSMIEELKKDYEKRDSGISIVNYSDVWKMSIRDDLLEKVRENIPVEMSKGLMKTLAVIAYKSPVEQQKVVKWRGTLAYGHIKELVERELVKREPSGKTFVLRVTPIFHEYFAVKKKGISKDVDEDEPQQSQDTETPESHEQDA